MSILAVKVATWRWVAFEQLWTAIWNSLAVTCLVPVSLIPTFDSVVLDFLPPQRGSPSAQANEQCRETRCLFFCPSSPYNSSLPGASWFLDGPVFFETETKAAKCQRAKHAGSFHRRTVSRLKSWMKRMWLTIKHSMLGGGITCPCAVTSQRTFCCLLIKSVRWWFHTCI